MIQKNDGIDLKLNEFFGSMYPNSSFFYTTSATSALDLACLGLGLKPGDEVIMPTFNYVGVAQAFIRNGVKVVLIDSDPNTMNINLDSAELAITSNTKALLVMHYGSIAADIEKAQAICKKHQIFLIEDNAQGIFAKYKNEYLGSFGDVACISFENNKNVSVGEGGVLIVKNKISTNFNEVYYTGTNKFEFDKGGLEFYQWKVKGFKYFMSYILKEILYEKLISYKNEKRLKLWKELYDKLSRKKMPISLVSIKPSIEHNAHLFWINFGNEENANSFIQFARKNAINATKHYFPMHLSQYALSNHSEVDTRFVNKNSIYNSLVRIPFLELGVEQVIYVFDLFFKEEKIH